LIIVRAEGIENTVVGSVVVIIIAFVVIIRVVREGEESIKIDFESLVLASA